ncbi:hypothetical protein [Ruegeria sp. Ofav3-42]|uniref:hypothetical protein n=1 Tax=Ruegeria sp. Ofav3-42 TaxID=2917759 RepID=UPI001EF69980|nr:hypothetical protein [Ruegeria sp. Ofav3-42]MCG7521550.1 hypothetical protein [Ruegeria sp. Ofav3-42]
MSVTNLAEPQDCMQAIGSYPFDTFETGLLVVARHHLDALRCPETQAWHLAYSIAAERWGDSIGLPAAHLLARFVKYVMQCRNDGFDYNDPFCEHSRGLVTVDEATLLNALHFMRRDDTSAARDAVESLTKGRLDPDVIRSGLTFANRFPAGASSQIATQSGAKLRVVR